MIDLTEFIEQNPGLRGRFALLGLFESYCSLASVTTLCQHRTITDLFTSVPETAWIDTFELLRNAQLIEALPTQAAKFPPETTTALRQVLADYYADVTAELERRFADHYAALTPGLVDAPTARGEVSPGPAPLHPEHPNLGRAVELAVRHQMWTAAMQILEALERLLLANDYGDEWATVLGGLAPPDLTAPLDQAGCVFWEAALKHLVTAAEGRHDLSGEEQHLLRLGLVYEQRSKWDAGAEVLRRLGQIALRRRLFPAAHSYYLQALESSRTVGDFRNELTDLLNISRVDMAQGQWDEATTKAEQSLALSRERSEPDAESAALLQLGDVAHHKGLIELARGFYEQCVQLAQSRSDPASEAAALELLGDLELKGNNQAAAAQPWLQRSAQLWKELGEERNEARVWTKIGDSLRADGAWDLAEGHYRRGLHAQIRLHDHAGQAQTLSRMGLLALERQDLAQAVQWFSQGHSLLDASSDVGGQAAIHDGLGTVAYLQNSFEQAEHHYKESLRLREELGHTSEQARVLYNLGLAAERKKELAAARHWHERSFELSAALGEVRKQLQALLQLASIALQQGHLQEAGQRCEEALLLAERIQAAREIAEIHYRLGRIADQLLQPGGADHYRRSLQIYWQEKDLTGHMKVVGHLAALSGVSREELAASYRQSLLLAEKTNAAEHQLTLLYRLAELGEATRHWHDAEVCYRRCLTIEEAVGSKIQQAYVLQRLGLVLEQEGRPAEMEALLQRSIQLGGFPGGDQPFHTTVLERLGRAALRNQEFEEALLYFQHCLKLAADHGDSRAQGKALLGLGRIAAGRGDAEHAQGWLEQALQLSSQTGEAREEIGALLELGDLARRSGNAKQAERHYLAALKLQQSPSEEAGLAQTLVRLGEVSEELERGKKALSYFEQAAALYTALQDAQNLYRVRTAVQRLSK